eukprot:SAG11_NODE_7229_length_1175_cov_0.953532_1_plen_249_part_10
MHRSDMHHGVPVKVDYAYQQYPLPVDFTQYGNHAQRISEPMHYQSDGDGIRWRWNPVEMEFRPESGGDHWQQSSTVSQSVCDCHGYGCQRCWTETQSHSSVPAAPKSVAVPTKKRVCLDDQTVSHPSKKRARETEKSKTCVRWPVATDSEGKTAARAVTAAKTESSRLGTPVTGAVLENAVFGLTDEQKFADAASLCVFGVDMIPAAAVGTWVAVPRSFGGWTSGKVHPLGIESSGPCPACRSVHAVLM